MLGKPLPKRRAGRIALGLVVLLLAGGLVAYLEIRHYLDTKPAEVADQYRKDTYRPFAAAADSMDRAYVSFDNYLSVFTLPRSVVRDAGDIQELKRRFLPVYDDTSDALDRAQHAINNARKQIDKSRKSLQEKVPEPKWVEDDPLLEEARETRLDAKRYLGRSERFLDTYERFVKYDTDAVKIRRRDLLNSAEHESQADDSLETLKSTLTSALANEKKILDDALALKDPPPDLKAYDDLTRESLTVTVDYYEDILQAIADLSITEYDAASDDAIAAYRRLSDRESDELAKFIANSKLQRSSRKLADDASKTEKKFAGLGSGSGNQSEYDRDRYRPKPPKPKPSGHDKKKGNLS